MWKILETGIAQWHVEDGIWNVLAAGGEEGISLHARDRGVALVEMQPVDNNPFPKAGECFVRGDCLHIDYPQTDGDYSLHLVLRTIDSSVEEWLLESTISIQTKLLDTHPTMDMVAVGDGFQVWTPPGERDQVMASASSEVGGAACLTGVVGNDSAITMMLSREDYPWTLDLSDDQEIRLRLFGEFLEKGVIRKARPWICIQRGCEDIDESMMVERWKQLQATPLPLTS